MNSKVMILLAGVMLIGAIIAGYLGYRASAQPAVAKPAKMELPALSGAEAGRPTSQDGRYAVVVAARELPALTVIRSEDVYIDYLRQVPPASFGRLDAVVGKKPWVNIPAGTVVGEGNLQPGGQLPKLIKTGERAVAIGVDEVVGGGGFVRPGDFVDVLLFTKDESYATQKSNDAAQVVLAGMRVLSYGPRIAITEAPSPEKAKEEEQKAADTSQSRTAVLAVPEGDVTKLMLAANVGSLRLAVRSPDEPIPVPVPTKDGKPGPLPDAGRHLILSSAIVPNRAGAMPSPAVRPVRQAAPKAPSEPKPSVIIYRGKEMQQVTP